MRARLITKRCIVSCYAETSVHLTERNYLRRVSGGAVTSVWRGGVWGTAMLPLLYVYMLLLLAGDTWQTTDYYVVTWCGCDCGDGDGSEVVMLWWCCDTIVVVVMAVL